MVIERSQLVVCENKKGKKQEKISETVGKTMKALKQRDEPLYNSQRLHKTSFSH